MKNICISLVCFSLFVSACCSERDCDTVYLQSFNTSSTVEDISDYLQITNVTPVSPEKVIGNHNVLRLKEKNGFFYLLDAQNYSLLLFDESGQSYGVLSRIGNGPGEYPYIKDFDVLDNGNICLLCGPDSRILTYSADLSYIDEHVLPFNAKAFAVEGENKYFFDIEREWDYSEKKDAVICTDSLFNVVFSTASACGLPISGFGERLNRSIDGSLLCLGCYDSNVYKINKEGLSTVISIDFKSHFFSEKFFEQGTIEGVYNEILSSTNYYLSDFFENDSYYVVYLLKMVDADDVASALWITDKNSGSSIIKYWDKDNYSGFDMMHPLGLNDKDELTFLFDVYDPSLLPFPLEGIEPDVEYVLAKFKICQLD